MLWRVACVGECVGLITGTLVDPVALTAVGFTVGCGVDSTPDGGSKDGVVVINEGATLGERLGHLVMGLLLGVRLRAVG
jgi:hypothetical protein